MLLAIHLYEYFINVEGISVAPMFAFQSACINGSELNAPESYRFSGYSDVSLSQEIFDIAVAQVEAIIEPDCVGEDVGRESMVMRWTPLVEPAS